VTVDRLQRYFVAMRHDVFDSRTAAIDCSGGCSLAICVILGHTVTLTDGPTESHDLCQSSLTTRLTKIAFLLTIEDKDKLETFMKGSSVYRLQTGHKVNGAWLHEPLAGFLCNASMYPINVVIYIESSVLLMETRFSISCFIQFTWFYETTGCYTTGW
jgi:hypothetical protein